MVASESLIPRGAVCARRLMLIPASASADRAYDDGASCASGFGHMVDECVALRILGEMWKVIVRRKARHRYFHMINAVRGSANGLMA